MQAETTAEPRRRAEAASWGSVFALTLCVATLIASEFMPVSLLTPIASDLGVSEGTAGQAIAVSGLFAVLTSLSISSVTRGIDRRTVLLSLTLADDRLGRDGRLRAEHRRLHGGTGARRRRHRRVLVDVGSDGHAPGAGSSGAARPWPPQRRQRACGHDRGAAWEFPRPVHRLARCFFRCRAARGHDARLAVRQPAVDAGERGAEAGPSSASCAAATFRSAWRQSRCSSWASSSSRPTCAPSSRR